MAVRQVMARLRRKAGFTLIETLLAIIVLIIMTGLVAAGSTSAVNLYHKLRFSSEADMLAANIDTAIAPVLRGSTGEPGNLTLTYKGKRYTHATVACEPSADPEHTNQSVVVIRFTDSEGLTKALPVINVGMYSDCTIKEVKFNKDHHTGVLELALVVGSLTTPDLEYTTSTFVYRQQDFSSGDSAAYGEVPSSGDDQGAGQEQGGTTPQTPDTSGGEQQGEPEQPGGGTPDPNPAEQRQKALQECFGNPLSSSEGAPTNGRALAEDERAFSVLWSNANEGSGEVKPNWFNDELRWWEWKDKNGRTFYAVEPKYNLHVVAMIFVDGVYYMPVTLGDRGQNWEYLNQMTFQMKWDDSWGWADTFSGGHTTNDFNIDEIKALTLNTNEWGGIWMWAPVTDKRVPLPLP